MTHAEHAEHAARARANVRALGAHDCIHNAPDWDRRADELYKLMNAWFAAGTIDFPLFRGDDVGFPWAIPALLDDGRMVVMGASCWLVEASA